MFKTPVIAPNDTSIPQRIGSENKRNLQKIPSHPPATQPTNNTRTAQNHTHLADLPSPPYADTYFTNSPSRPNMKPLNPPPARRATRTRAPHG